MYENSSLYLQLEWSDWKAMRPRHRVETFKLPREHIKHYDCFFTIIIIWETDLITDPKHVFILLSG